MLTQLKGPLWSTLEQPIRGVELARCGWGAPDALAGLPPEEVPGVWLTNPITGGLPAVVQRFFLPRGEVRPVIWEGRNVGAWYEDAYAEYALLMGVGPSDSSADRVAQTASTFANIEGALKTVGFTFHDVVRTWFYLDELLAWYDDFNRARDAFFESRGVFDGFVPASTGIGCANAFGTAILSGIIAMRPKAGGGASRAILESPLQCSALDYRSSFSRAAEIVTPEGRLVFISGTASIEPGGATAYVGDIERQIALTMEVVGAILATREMTFKQTTRAIAYIKCPEYRPYWQAWLAANHLPADFAQEVICDVCRDDLLFELELDAVARR